MFYLTSVECLFESLNLALVNPSVNVLLEWVLKFFLFVYLKKHQLHILLSFIFWSSLIPAYRVNTLHDCNIRLGANSCRSCHYPYIKSKLTEKCHLFSKRKPVWILGFLGFFPQTCAIAGGVCLSGPRRDCFGCQGAMYRRRLSNAAIGKPSRP